MAETLEKYEFGSEEWVDMVRGIVDEGLAGEDLAGINFCLYEEYTDPPAHLRQPGSDTVGLYVRVENGNYEVGGQSPGDTTYKVVGDYAAMKDYALRPFSPTDPDPETVALRQQMIDEGKMRLERTIVRTQWPAIISNLDLHNRVRLQTC